MANESEGTTKSTE